MSEMIPLSVPSIEGNEWKYVKECLDTGWVSSAGSFVDRFEKSICAFTGARYAVACVNGTAALQVSLRLAGVKPGDEVILPTLTFIAPVNAVRYLGGEPVFMDCDECYNMDIDKTIAFIEAETVFRDGYTFNKRTNKRIPAIVPVHVFGNAVRLHVLIDFCKERNIKIVEDATESLGTVYKEGILAGKHTGTIGDIGCYSFNGNKIITTGGGGMIVTNATGYAERARYLTTQAKDDEIRYIHDDVGYNFRLTNIQAALGVAQMERLPEYLATKRASYNSYKKEIDQIAGLHLADAPGYANNNYWMYALQIDAAVYGKDREALMGYLQEKRIQTRPVWNLNHLQKPYRECQHYEINMAPRLLARTLNIPCSVNLTKTDINRVVECLRNA